MVIIETKRLILRELAVTDVQGIYNLDSDPDVHQYFGNSLISNLKEALNVIEFIRNQYQENGMGRLAIIEKETNTFIGWSGFKFVKTEINRHQNYYDLGCRSARESRL